MKFKLTSSTQKKFTLTLSTNEINYQRVQQKGFDFHNVAIQCLNLGWKRCLHLVSNCASNMHIFSGGKQCTISQLSGLHTFEIKSLGLIQGFNTEFKFELR